MIISGKYSIISSYTVPIIRDLKVTVFESMNNNEWRIYLASRRCRCNPHRHLTWRLEMGNK